MSNLVCDFCLSPDIQWSFPCQTFTTDIGILEVGSLGAWAACPACHALIVRGDRVRLARRAAKSLIKRHPQIGFEMSRLTNDMRKLQDDFWSHRMGAPVRASKPKTFTEMCDEISAEYKRQTGREVTPERIGKIGNPVAFLYQMALNREDLSKLRDL